jgi:1-deoxy-D-xylulose-5-phosphate synthase
MTDNGKKQSILNRINKLKDIKTLDSTELNILAEEIRTIIIDTVSQNGGHLASSLGVVELTIAIHYVFDTPRDKLIWDVGHQTYAHKILTGRKNRFHTLRRKGGISGFPNTAESIYDTFNVGHSGTSISAASGIAEAKCLMGEDVKTIAVIGDGSMTTGMTYEAINWAGSRGKNIVVILNDNEMSISPNVGAISAYLNRLMTGQTITQLKLDIKRLMKNIPLVGEQMIKFTRQMEESLKAFFAPGILFEELGFTYVGPLEGHRIDRLIKTLENVKNFQSPVIVHVITKKGKGYRYAEENPAAFHGISPFNIDTGKPLLTDKLPPIPSYTEIFGKTIMKMARENPRIVAVTAAMCDGTGLTQFAREFPKRFYDVGIAEQHGVTFAAGLATEGMIPVVAIYSTFLQRAYDQILHDVCLQKLPVIFAIDRAGFVGEDGQTHHGLFDYTYMRSMPHIIVMAPKDENELQHMLKTAISCGKPVSVRYPRGRGAGVPMDDEPVSLEIGKGEIIMEGEDMAIIAVGSCVQPAVSAARKLKDENISVMAINARFIKPLDEKLLCNTGRLIKKIITVEENVLMGGFGSAVLELFAKEGLSDVTVKTLGIGDMFVEHAAQEELRRMYGLDEEGIMAAARTMIAM